MEINLKSNNTRSKTFKTASIVFCVLGVIYLWIRFLAKSIVNSDKVCHANKCFIVEIADTDETRQLGLMNRESMGTNRWMLFVFEKLKKHSFWMKNTLIPLDMIRIDSDLTIVDIQTAQPCNSNVCETYVPQGDATYVLEINAWTAEEYNIKLWDKLEIK